MKKKILLRSLIFRHFSVTVADEMCRRDGTRLAVPASATELVRLSDWAYLGYEYPQTVRIFSSVFFVHYRNQL